MRDTPMVLGTRILLFAVIGFISVCIFTVGILATSYVHNADYGNRTESQIIAEYTRAQNVRSNAATTVMDVANINQRYADNVLEIVTVSMAARADFGSDAMVSMLNEQNIELPHTTAQEVTRVIMSGRTDFQNAQNRLIDVRRSYETKLGTLYDGFFLRLAGYPKIDLDDYQIIIDSSTRQAFETGVDQGFIQ